MIRLASLTSDTVTEQQVAVQVVEGGLQRWSAHQVWSAPRTCALGRDDRCSPAGTGYRALRRRQQAQATSACAVGQ
jgi:hypothetical protein